MQFDTRDNKLHCYVGVFLASANTHAGVPPTVVSLRLPIHYYRSHILHPNDVP